VAEGIGDVQIQMAADLAGGEGQIAILSATSTAPNQNEWIGFMEEELEKPEYSGLELVATVYGDDEDEKSYNEAIGLMQTYPDLKVIISPTTVGIAASARAVQDAGRVGEVFVTGLGTPNQMREYVNSGAAPQFALWNPADLGYSAWATTSTRKSASRARARAWWPPRSCPPAFPGTTRGSKPTPRSIPMQPPRSTTGSVKWTPTRMAGATCRMAGRWC
jgi:rhamnose transport system substrate-binding protein